MDGHPSHGSLRPRPKGDCNVPLRKLHVLPVVHANGKMGYRGGGGLMGGLEKCRENLRCDPLDVLQRFGERLDGASIKLDVV